MTEFRPRRSIDLDGRWEFVTDPTESGIDDGWMDPAMEWPDQAQTVDVPLAWEELDEFREYTGRAWYRRTFTLETPLGDRDAILRFGAVDYKSVVWVNSRKVGTNEGGYLPFEFDVTDAITEGENTVVIAVTDPDDVSEIPHGKQGDPWYTRVSGIWQSVGLDLRPPARVTDVWVTPDLSTDTATVEVDVQPGPHDRADIDIHMRARNQDGKAVAEATTGGTSPVEAVLSFDSPDYWSPDDPTLYELEIELLVDGTTFDSLTEPFGLRSFDTDGRQFLLNEEPITMRGVLEQGYYPDTLYRPGDPDTFEQEVAIAKELGFNLIRKHIKPAHPEFLEAADRLGMLVWEEPASPTLSTENSRAAVREQLLGMVDRDYNHPSVVVWSIYNEEWGFGHANGEETLWTDESKQQYLADQYRDLRERDPTRLVCDNSGWAHVGTDINDFHRYFVSPDRAEEWSTDLDHICHHPYDNYATRAFDDKGAPIVLSELGTWGFCDVPALRAHYGGDPPWFTHEYLTEEFKRPAGVDERFRSTDLSAVFDDYEALADAWQQREYVSLKHILEEVRTHEEVAGYVLTELSDIEWEFNGILDYRREQKNFHDEFAAVNAPIAVVVDLDSHVVYDEDALSVGVTVVNDTDEELSGTVEWSLSDRSGSATLSVPSHAVASLDEAITLESPKAESVTRETLSTTFDSTDSTVSTTEPITIVPAQALPTPDATVFAEGTLASRLTRRNVSVTHDLENADLAIVEQITDDVESFADAGGAVIHAPSGDGRMANEGPFDYHHLPEHESWSESASFLYTDSPIFEDLCPGSRLGWAFENVYPFAVATDLDPNTDKIHAGYVEGWLANWASPLVTRSYGDGSVTAFTFRVRDHYADHPVATLVVDRLLAELSQ
ncbi:glycoside hydrolase family 2 protein [Halorhabdus amylolytica]|uniref:glycoside hydrolase family 2 protein n=1 Tax=Halorhabdus amylolytica TaxID=2559573 RepID=UPI0010A9E11A|nr:sugar-binding domain-containing protein [Halorhabdus amylolytica]